MRSVIEQGLVYKLERLHADIGLTYPAHTHASHLLVCDDCDEIAKVQDSGVVTRLKAAGKSVGYRSKRPVVELLRICAQCTSKQDR